MTPNWQKLIARYSLEQLQGALPHLSTATAYGWLAGRRSPPPYAQAPLAEWLKSKAPPATKGPPRTRA